MTKQGERWQQANKPDFIITPDGREVYWWRAIPLMNADHAAASRAEAAEAVLREAHKLLARADSELFHGSADTREDWLADYAALTPPALQSDAEGGA